MQRRHRRHRQRAELGGRARSVCSPCAGLGAGRPGDEPDRHGLRGAGLLSSPGAWAAPGERRLRSTPPPLSGDAPPLPNPVQLAALGPNSAIFNFVFQVRSPAGHLPGLVSACPAGHKALASEQAAPRPQSLAPVRLPQLFAFLGVTTTSLVARNSLAAPGLTEKELAQRRHAAESTLSHALVLAAACGLVAAAVLRLWGAAALRGMGAGAELMGPALQYLEIRWG